MNGNYGHPLYEPDRLPDSNRLTHSVRIGYVLGRRYRGRTKLSLSDEIKQHAVGARHDMVLMGSSYETRLLLISRCLVDGDACRRGHVVSIIPGAHAVRRASVGDSRAARNAGSKPASAPMARADPKPPAHATTGTTTAHPFVDA